MKGLCNYVVVFFSNMDANGNKTGGRKKGTPNKNTKKMKDAVAELLDSYSNSGQMIKDFMKLEPKDRLFISEKLMQYTVPKLQAVDLSTEEGKKLTIEERLIQLSKIPDQNGL